MNNPVTENELLERAVAPRVTLEALEENIISEVYFTAHQGARASLLDNMVDALVQPTAEEIAGGLENIPSALRLLTICVLTLKNGFTIIGQSACASPENYQKDIGERISRKNAVDQVWNLMGYELRSKLMDLTNLRSVDDHLGEALTRMTAYGLGNKEVLRPSDIDVVVSHFIHDQGEEGGKTYSDMARQAIVDGVDISSIPEMNTFNQEPNYILNPEDD